MDPIFRKIVLLLVCVNLAHGGHNGVWAQADDDRACGPAQIEFRDYFPDGDWLFPPGRELAGSSAYDEVRSAGPTYDRALTSIYLFMAAASTGAVSRCRPRSDRHANRYALAFFGRLIPLRN